MYTFNAIPDVPVDHTGLFIIGFFAVAMLIIVLMNEPESFFVWFFLSTVIVGFAYMVSYQWTDQEPKTFANTKVTAELVGFQPEGYNERSGKSRADRHYMYVVYAVGGQKVILKASEGVTYPQTAILYKN